jgi:hypothetical protein
MHEAEEAYRPADDRGDAAGALASGDFLKWHRESHAAERARSHTCPRGTDRQARRESNPRAAHMPRRLPQGALVSPSRHLAACLRAATGKSIGRADAVDRAPWPPPASALIDEGRLVRERALAHERLKGAPSHVLVQERDRIAGHGEVAGENVTGGPRDEPADDTAGSAPASETSESRPSSHEIDAAASVARRLGQKPAHRPPGPTT